MRPSVIYDMGRFYKEYGELLTQIFGNKVQKISVNTGNVCPNRDGSIGVGGCIYCNNTAFTPGYAQPALGVEEQLSRGVEFFGKKYPGMRYLAYFQSYTSTHSDIDSFVATLQQALDFPGVVGAVIGTRPDCMPSELLSRLEILNKTKPIIVEYGAESSHNTTLEHINRCHTWQQTVDAVQRTAQAGLHVGLHLIMGLPGETKQMMLDTVDAVNTLPISSVKFHQLQIVRGTPLARIHEQTPIKTFTVEEYLDLCKEIIMHLRPDIAIDRFVSQTPPELLIAPRWNLKNYQFAHLLENTLSKDLSHESN